MVEWKVSVCGSFLILFGLGTLFLHRWAAVGLSLGFAAVALWLMVGSIWHVPFPWILLSFAVVAGFCFPALATLYAWKSLR
ncbi:MAG: hypothetical protein QOG67_2264 [Verrucomicrobiota bacterium]|jgi:hypothetical protein